MICEAPKLVRGQSFPCGACLACLHHRRRKWTHRIILESYQHTESCFVTLTYEEEKLPENGSLVPEHVTGFLRRLKRSIFPLDVRYFACGEYGDQTFRPHYHLILFGIGGSAEELIKKAWSFGFVKVGEVTWQSAAYVCGYVTKKMTSRSDPRLLGRFPEFTRMSLRPGIGAYAMSDVARVVNSVHGVKVIARDGDVPLSLDHGKKRMPLDRYLRRKLREESGHDAVPKGKLRVPTEEEVNKTGTQSRQEKLNFKTRLKIFHEKKGVI